MRTTGSTLALSISLPATRTTSLPGRYDSVKPTMRLPNTRGEETARALLIENPLAAFEGKPLPYVPDVCEDGDSAKPAGLKRGSASGFSKCALTWSAATG